MRRYYKNTSYVTISSGDSLLVEGNLGIGTTSPGAKLEIANGDIKVSKAEAVLDFSLGNPKIKAEDSMILEIDSNNDATGAEGLLKLAKLVIRKPHGETGALNYSHTMEVGEILSRLSWETVLR